MSELYFLTAEQVCEIQAITLPGVPCSDTGKVHGTVVRVLNAYYYENVTDTFELAAMYLIAIARGHAFPDANKRTAFQAAATFLDMNGLELRNSDELVRVTVLAASGGIDRIELSEYLKALSKG